MGNSTASTSSLVQTLPVLAGRKRKRADTLVVYCSTDEHSEADKSPAAKTRKYACSYEGCTKAYTKPSRLDEHIRSHTGERPFQCATCSKSYLRESHLNAHARTHMDASEKKFVCPADKCGKAFWTSQHLKVHTQVHEGVKPFACTADDCHERFSKHHQLRAHVAKEHCPPGTKPFRCEHEDCDKSFATTQKLTAHAKTHEEKRYACSHPSCTSLPTGVPYFSKWTGLQQHMREAHPPTCPHATCNGRTFASQANLRAHITLHVQRAVDDELVPSDESEEDEDLDERPRKRRRGGEIGRDWRCAIDDCPKAFKSKNALMTHTKVAHAGIRDFVCDVPSCGKSYGYKHLLQRHTLKVHNAELPTTDDDDEMDISSSTTEDDAPGPSNSAINFITGKRYLEQKRSAPNAQAQTLVTCPYPSHFCSSRGDTATPAACRFVFSRAYDLRRHLRAEHDEEWEKDEVDVWVRKQKKALATE
ncbi:hypothetical protein EXIGLDRAFT_722267 [Exidia glandulosa HHB12029]|uniref:C2H2-type domain-containing protein n=1 Tax=Exidia glandulosa HHB12029 TaxID=1314781 RepID=A0A165N4L4_EXIGL|nr:hypothetical protein EXIGLDRAFT_722267 [Exidia glandulosa HHB12029]